MEEFKGDRDLGQSIAISDDDDNLVNEEGLRTTNVDENLLNVGGGEVSVLLVSDNGDTSDEERFSRQESVGGLRAIDDPNDEVKIQTNGTAIHAEQDCDHNLDLSSSDKDSFNASIQKVGSSDQKGSLQLSSSEHVNSDILLANPSKGVEAENTLRVDSSLLPSVSSVPINPAPTTTKGHGLKKWRRIRREITKDGSFTLDFTKMLKRGPGTILDMKQPSDGSVSSTKAIVDVSGHADFFSHPVTSSNYKLAIGTTFSAGADDNDDKSSKSSTAASAPKHRHDSLRASGQREKQKLKHTSGRHFNSSGQRVHPGKGHAQADTSKKHRGGNTDVEKENSLSSMESDSRSCSSVFLRGSSSVNSDQLQSGRSVNFDGEDTHDQRTYEVQSAEELPADHCKNGILSPDCSAENSCSANEENSKNHHLPRDCEPLVNSILMLQSAQEALEKEIQMFKEIGKGIRSLCDDSGKSNGASASSKFLDPKSRWNPSSNDWGPEFDHIQTVERQLEEANLMLKEKEVRVVELEKTMESMESLQVDARTNMELSHKKCKEMEAELEGLLKQKIEAEVQYVAMTRSTKALGFLVEDQNKLLEEQKSVASEQAQSLKLMSDVGSKAAILQGQAEELDTLVTDTDEGEEIQMIRSRVFKFASRLLLQLILLVLVLGLFVSQFLPKSTPVVPT